MNGFARQLKIGKTGESEIAQWLMARGRHVLPAYEITGGEYQGPVFYSSDGRRLVTPDMLVFGPGSIAWVEAKNKTAFTFHRISNRFVTGIDLRVYADYLMVSKLSELEVFLMFLQQPGIAKDSPPGPSGLYCARLSMLKDNESHRANGRDGMVYWPVEAFQRLDDYPLNVKRISACQSKP